MTIDLNADAGESFGHWTQGNDEALFPYLSSVKKGGKQKPELQKAKSGSTTEMAMKCR